MSYKINKNGIKKDKLSSYMLYWKVYPNFIPDGDQIISKTYMTRVEGENTRLRHYLARLHRKTLCYSKSVEMLKSSISLLIHYLKFQDIPIPYWDNSRSLYLKIIP